MSRGSLSELSENRSWTARQIALDRGLDPDVTDNLKYAVERHLYHYGSHFRNGFEGVGRTLPVPEAVALLESAIPAILRIEGDAGWLDRVMEPYRGKRILFDCSYINRGAGTADAQGVFRNVLASSGWTLVPPPWADPAPRSEDWRILSSILGVFETTQTSSVQLLLNPDYQALLARVLAILRKVFAAAPIGGLLAPYAETLFERASLRMCTEMGKVSMVVLHGALPGAATPESLGPARHIVVWGEAIRRSFVESGLDPSRVVVVGNPLVEKLPGPVARPDFHSCLVLTRAQNGAPTGDNPIHQNRGELVQYIDEVQRVLKRMGVRSARLRPHPSESVEWYREFADPRFYTLDEDTLARSLAGCGLVIGPSSSVLVDAHMLGKPYIVYEPAEMVHAEDLGLPLIPPFDGSVPGLPFADSVEALERVLRAPFPTDTSFWGDFLTFPPRPEALIEAIEGRPAPAAPAPAPASAPAGIASALARAEARVAAPATARDMETIAAVRPFTMTPPARIQSLLRLVDHISVEGVVGDMVECGVWKGGSIMSAAIRLLENNCRNRDIYLYDTFEGMSAPTENDVSPEGLSAADLLRDNTKDKSNHIWAYSPLEDVQRNMDSTGYPSVRVRYVRGKVEDTIPGILPRRIALLRLDTDWYESTLHELEHMYPLLESGGVLLLDDYGFWQGARKAVDEYFSRLAEPPVLHIIHDGVDDSARWCIKP